MQADIFCRVVDNYGDVGVCWRLARRLAHGFGWQVRLWVDELASFARLAPAVQPQLARQTVAGIQIEHWSARPDPTLQAGDVVIEAFACDPPPAFLASMRQQRPIWINLDYLSAEDWVEGCHGLPSLQPGGLTKYFFFPGFTPATGGLLREPGLSAERDALQAAPAQQENLLRRLGLNNAALAAWRSGARLCTLFCYPQAPLAGLLQGLASQARPTLLLAPAGVAPGLEALTSPATGVTLARIPFVDQPDFDRLLWCAELNFVRGEDSFVRAAWAARPLVWHIYPQDENVHLNKLQAWLERYPAPPQAQALIRHWNSPDPAALAAALDAALTEPAWSNWQAAAARWDAQLAARADLGQTLANFCADLIKKR